MINRYLFLPLFFLLFFVNVSAQKVTNDKILQLEVHPSEDGKFIAKFFDKATLKIIEQWEMKAMVPEIDANNFNDLLKDRRIYPDGISYTFYPKVKLKSETIYKNGVRVGEEKGFYENRKPKYQANFNNLQEGVTEFFYENGVVKRSENYTKGKLNGTVKEFYANGKKKGIASYENGKMLGKYQSYYPNGKVKRKTKFEFDKEITGKCFDQNGNTIPCSPFYTEPTYPGGLSALRKEIEKFDFSFNLENTDTANFRIMLELDTLGIARRVNYHFEHADSLQAAIRKWGNSLAQFAPAIIDGCPSPSYLNISVAVSGNKIVWLGEPTLAHALFAFNNEVEKKQTWFWEFPNPTNPDLFFIVENMPEFPGGESALKKHISNNIIYPDYAQKNGIEGKVYVSFIVEKDGSVSSERIARGAHAVLNAEALRVIKHLPDWKPGTKRNKPVRVSYTVPVNFVLRSKTPVGSSVQTVPRQRY